MKLASRVLSLLTGVETTEEHDHEEILREQDREQGIKRYMRYLWEYHTRAGNYENAFMQYNIMKEHSPQAAESYLSEFFSVISKNRESRPATIPEAVIDRQEDGKVSLNTAALVGVVYTDVPDTVDPYDTAIQNTYNKLQEIEDADSLDETVAASLAYVIHHLDVNAFLYRFMDLFSQVKGGKYILSARN